MAPLVSGWSVPERSATPTWRTHQVRRHRCPCDRRPVPEAARLKAAKYDVAAAGDVAFVLDHPAVEIVVNLTIPAAHAEVASEVIAAGKNVWNEKPLALDRFSGQRLLDDAAAAGGGSVVPQTPSGSGRRLAGLSSRA